MDIFYPEYSERLIAVAFSQKPYEFYQLMREAENKLTADDFAFELNNDCLSLQEAEAEDIRDWVQTILRDYSYWKLRQGYMI